MEPPRKICSTKIHLDFLLKAGLSLAFYTSTSFYSISVRLPGPVKSSVVFNFKRFNSFVRGNTLSAISTFLLIYIDGARRQKILLI